MSVEIVVNRVLGGTPGYPGVPWGTPGVPIAFSIFTICFGGIWLLDPNGLIDSPDGELQCGVTNPLRGPSGTPGGTRGVLQGTLGYPGVSCNTRGADCLIAKVDGPG